MFKKAYLYLLIFTVGSLAACSTAAELEDIAIIPTPLKSKITSGHNFSLREGLIINVSDDTLLQAGVYFQNVLERLQTQIVVGDNNADIHLIIDDKMSIKDGGYTLTIDSNLVKIKAKDYSGIVSGIATFRQLLPVDFLKIDNQKPLVIPGVDITDAPRFSWRGFMLDSSRHFWTTEEVKQVLDLMAYYKLNKFHWHLTDDQGWRIEIKRYPLLTEKGAWRKLNNQDRICLDMAAKENNTDYLLPQDKLSIIDGDTIYGGYYSQADIKEIVGYAGQRGIDVIPEVDMPGHFLAAIDQYPSLTCDNMKGWGDVFSSPICVGKDKAIEFCENVYKEVFELFPYEYVHMGGDEVDKTNWKKCPDCQRRMRKEGLSTEEELQAWFVRHMDGFFKANGKRFIGWDEVVEDNLSDNAAIMWWRGWNPSAIPTATSEGKQAINTHNVYLYFDYQQDKTTLEKLLDYNPIVDGLTPEQEKLILGVQANLWTEWIPSMQRLEYMMLPRMLALSEIAWANLDNKMTIDKFYKAFINQVAWMDFAQVNYRIPDLEGFYDTNVFVDEATLELIKHLPTAEVRYTTDGTIPTKESELYTGPIKVTETTEFKLRTFRPNGTASDVALTKYIKSPYLESVEVENISNGLIAKWYYYGGDKCADIETAPFKGEYIINSVSIPEEAKGNIGLVINGYINIPKDGIYTFALLSDDGSIMSIGDDLTIDNDGPHAPKEVIGQKALKAGLHPIEIKYFDHNGGVLKLDIIDENGERVTLDESWLKH